MLDDETFYADCRALLCEDGVMSVNLFGRQASFERSMARIAAAFGADRLWHLKPTREGNTIAVATHTAVVPDRHIWLARADNIESRYGLPARKWLRLVQPWMQRLQRSMSAAPGRPKQANTPSGGRWSHSATGSSMSPTATKPRSAARATPMRGRLEWRAMLGWLREDGWIGADDVDAVVKRFGGADSSQHPLVRLGSAGLKRAGTQTMLDTEALTQWLAQRFNLTYLRIDPLKVDVGRVADVMSVHYAEVRRVLPVKVGATEVTIATAEPFDNAWVPEIEAHTRKTIRLVVANPLDIARYTTEFFSLAKSVRAAQKTGENSAAANFEQLVELGKTNKQLDANDAGVVQVVDWLWQYAFDQRASDIHLEPRRDMGLIRFRIDGVLHTVYQVPMTVMSAMTARIKLLGRMDVIEKRRPLDGRIKTKRPDGVVGAGAEVEMRLSTIPTAFGEKMVMRIFDPDTTVKTVEALGFSAHDGERWNQLISQSPRHHPRHRPHRQRQDHHAVLHAEEAGHRRGQRLHDRRPDRDDRALVQPDAGAQRHRHGLRRRPARADAPGPRHHHGRRDPRSGHRRDGDPGRAHRPPGVQHPAHQRRRLGDHAAGRSGRAAVPDQRHRDRRAGAAAGAHAVPVVQATRRRRARATCWSRSPSRGA